MFGDQSVTMAKLSIFKHFNMLNMIIPEMRTNDYYEGWLSLVTQLKYSFAIHFFFDQNVPSKNFLCVEERTVTKATVQIENILRGASI